MPTTGKPVSVSAVIPCHNYGRFLSRAITSILAQTYRVAEIIIVDDGSTDHTREIVAGFGERVRYIYQDNRGVSTARNTGIRAASGDWIAFLDADDWWLPQKIELQLQAITSRLEAVLVYTSVVCQNQDGSSEVFPATDPRRLWPALRFANCITGSASAALVRREALLAEGGFNEDIHGCEDWDCWVRLARKYAFTAVSDPVTVLTVWPGSVSHNNHCMLTNIGKLSDTTLVDGITGWRRSLWRRRIWSAALFGAALNARQQDPRQERTWLLQSLLDWPSPVFMPKRWWALYKNLSRSGISRMASQPVPEVRV